MRKIDPRGYQIAILGGLLFYGVWSLDFESPPVGSRDVKLAV